MPSLSVKQNIEYSKRTPGVRETIMKIRLKRFGRFVLFLALLNGTIRASHCAAVKLSGLYRGFPSVAQFGAATGESYVFSSSGDVYRGWIGAQLPAAFDWAHARAKEPDKTGKYIASGDKITFRWSNGQSENANFRTTRGADGKITMSIGSSFCYKIVPWGKTLNGTFSPATYQGGFADSKPQTPAIVDRIVFTTNGNFIITDDNGKTTKGRYKVVGASLTLILPDGKTRLYSLHIFADSKTPPSAVLIDGRPFNRS